MINKKKMKESKGVYVTRRTIKQDFQRACSYENKTRVKQLIANCAVKRYEKGTHETGCQVDAKKDLVCTCRPPSAKQESRYFTAVPEQVYAYHGLRSYTNTGVGSVKALQKKKVLKIYLPETDDRGVGSNDLSTYFFRKAKLTNRGYFASKSTSSKCVGGVPDFSYPVVNEKLSPIVKCLCATTGSEMPKAIDDKSIEISSQGNNTEDKKFVATTTQVEMVNMVVDAPVDLIRASNAAQNASEIHKEPSKVRHRNKSLAAKAKAREEEKFSSDSLVQHIHDLECPSKQSRPSDDPVMENKIEREYRQIFAAKSKSNQDQPAQDNKSTSLLRRRFEALRRGRKRDEPRNALEVVSSSPASVASHKDVSIASDPPSLEARSFNNTRPSGSPYKTAPTYDRTSYRRSVTGKRDKESLQTIDDESELNQGVSGMFRLWGKKFNLDDQKKTLKTDDNSKIDESFEEMTSDVGLPQTDSREKKTGGRKFSFFKKKSKDKTKPTYKSKKGVTANRCEVKNGLVLKIAGTNAHNSPLPELRKQEPVPDKYEEILRKAWLKKYLTNTIDSRDSVKIRWNNTTYTTSSSTVFELMDNVYKHTGVVIRSKSDITTHKPKKPSHNKRVNFIHQNIEAWMIPKTIQDRQMLIPIKIKSSPDKGDTKNIEVRIPDQKWSIDTAKTFSRKIELVLHSNNVVQLNNQSSDFLRIDIPRHFFSDSTTCDEQEHQCRTSDEEVYKIVEYETLKSNSDVKKIPNFDTGDHSTNEITVTVSVKDSKNMESKVLEKVIKRPSTQRDVVIQGSSVFFPKRCDVIGVGIITQMEMKPILKLQDDLSEDESEPTTYNPKKNCEFAQSYLQDYYRHLMPQGIDLFPSGSKSNIKCCSEKNSVITLNQGDGSKSCPNIHEEFHKHTKESSSDLTSNSHCGTNFEEEINNKNKIFFGKFQNYCKEKLPIPQLRDFTCPDKEKCRAMFKLIPKHDDQKRVLPKDSVEVLKKRKIYAITQSRSKWSSCPGQGFSLPTLDDDTCPKKSSVIYKPNVKKKKSNCIAKHVNLSQACPESPSCSRKPVPCAEDPVPCVPPSCSSNPSPTPKPSWLENKLSLILKPSCLENQPSLTMKSACVNSKPCPTCEPCKPPCAESKESLGPDINSCPSGELPCPYTKPCPASKSPCQATKSPCQVSQSPCQVSQSPSRDKKTTCPASKSPSQDTKSPCQVSQSPSRAQKSTCPAWKSPSQATKSPCQVSQSPCQVSQSPSRAKKSTCPACKSPSQATKSPCQVSQSPCQVKCPPRPCSHSEPSPCSHFKPSPCPPFKPSPCSQCKPTACSPIEPKHKELDGILNFKGSASCDTCKSNKNIKINLEPIEIEDPKCEPDCIHKAPYCEDTRPAATAPSTPCLTITPVFQSENCTPCNSEYLNKPKCVPKRCVTPPLPIVDPKMRSISPVTSSYNLPCIQDNYSEREASPNCEIQKRRFNTSNCKKPKAKAPPAPRECLPTSECFTPPCSDKTDSSLQSCDAPRPTSNHVVSTSDSKCQCLSKSPQACPRRTTPLPPPPTPLHLRFPLKDQSRACYPSANQQMKRPKNSCNGHSSNPCSLPSPCVNRPTSPPAFLSRCPFKQPKSPSSLSPNCPYAAKKLASHPTLPCPNQNRSLSPPSLPTKCLLTYRTPNTGGGGGPPNCQFVRRMPSLQSNRHCIDRSASPPPPVKCPFVKQSSSSISLPSQCPYMNQSASPPSVPLKCSNKKQNASPPASSACPRMNRTPSPPSNTPYQNQHLIPPLFPPNFPFISRNPSTTRGGFSPSCTFSKPPSLTPSPGDSSCGSKPATPENEECASCPVLTKPCNHCTNCNASGVEKSSQAGVPSCQAMKQASALHLNCPYNGPKALDATSSPTSVCAATSTEPSPESCTVCPRTHPPVEDIKLIKNIKSKFTGLFLRKAASKKTDQTECDDCEHMNECNDDTNDDFREMKLQDEDGLTLCERTEYKKPRSSIHRPSVLGDMYEASNVCHRVSTHTSEHKVTSCNKKCILPEESSQSLANLVEIEFKMRVTQGDKITEINIGNDGDSEKEKVTKMNAHSSRDVYVVNNKVSEPVTINNNSGNDIDIRIVIKNFKTKNKKVTSEVVNKDHVLDDFTRKISEKFHTVSTGYSDIVHSEGEHTGQPSNAFSVHRATWDLTCPSDEKTKPVKTSGELSDSTDKETTNINTYTSQSAATFTESVIKDDEIIEKPIDEKESYLSTNISVVKSDASKQEEEREVNIVTDDTDQDTGMDICVVSSSDGVKRGKTNKAEKKKMLKMVIEKAGRIKHKNKDKVSKITKMLKTILTSDSSDHTDMAVTKNDLAKDITYASLPPSILRDTDSMNNFFKVTDPMSDNVRINTSKDSDDMSYDDEPPPRKTCGPSCICSQVAAKLNVPKSGRCCCLSRPHNADMETNCDIRTDEDMFLFNYSTSYVDQETQRSRLFCSKANSVNITFLKDVLPNELNFFNVNDVENLAYNFGNISEEANLIKKKSLSDESESNVKKSSIDVLNLSDEDKVIIANMEPAKYKIETVYTEVMHNKERRWKNSSNDVTPADILQSYETKKAVLEMYTERILSDEGERLVAKLPKFSLENESDIIKYEEIYTRSVVFSLESMKVSTKTPAAPALDDSEDESDTEFESIVSANVTPVTSKFGKQKRSAVNRSDSEDSVNQDNLKSKKTIKKRKSSSTSSAASKKKGNQNPHDLFGIFPEDFNITPKSSGSSNALDSSIINRLPTGATKRACVLKGEFFVELKVYHTNDIRSELPDQRWKKALLAVKAQVDSETPQWESLQKFVRRLQELFVEADVTFYPNNK